MPPPMQSGARPAPAAARLQRVHQRRQDACAAGADRMSQRDRAAVDVDFRGIELELADDGQRLRGEGFVQLDEVEVVERRGPRAATALRIASTGPMPMIIGSTPAVQYARMRASGLRPSSCAFFAVAITSAAAPSLMPDALPAVTEPSLTNAGRSAASVSAVVPARGYSSFVDLQRRSFALRHVYRHDLPIEDARVDRVRRSPLALGCERVLVGARDAVALARSLRRSCPCGSR